jgi:TetR/AcrR family tetracycline transcriptional repressor
MARTRRRARQDGEAAGQGGTSDHAGAAALPPLDRERIVGAALALLDELGLDGLSMRRLADRLGITAASLYWYLRDKEELLSLLADAISGEVPLPAVELSWRARLETLLWAYRRVLLAHRDAARLLSGTMPAGPHRLRRIDMLLEVLCAAGFEDRDAVRAGRVLSDYVTAFVLEEATEAALVAAPEQKEQSGGGEGTPAPASSPFASASAEAYPTIAALAAHLAAGDGDGRFRFGLTVLFDGLERQLARPRACAEVSSPLGPPNRPGPG